MNNMITIKVREYRRGNQNWTIPRNWQHRLHKTKKNIGYTRRKKPTMQYVLDTAMRKPTQTMKTRHDPSYKQLEVKTN
jgi:hypothetical protein